MKASFVRLALMAALSLAPVAVRAQSGVDRLYILDCGQGSTPDLSRWTPGANAGVAKDFVDSCYLIHHAQGWMLWDTGVPDAVAAMPEGLAPSDPKAVRWKRPKTLAAQMAEVGVKPGDLKYMAVSHSHPDHIGNVELFPQTMLLVQKAEYDWPAPFGLRFKAEHPVTKLEGDRDVFGDGSVTILATPGHTPGHQSLLVKLPKTGAVILSGDAAHFRANFDNRVTPSMNMDASQTQVSLQRIADMMAKEKAQFWINHDKAQRDTLKMAPAFYE
jgi:N-acyl homoserine lactone hydrolase